MNLAAGSQHPLAYGREWRLPEASLQESSCISRSDTSAYVSYTYALDSKCGEFVGTGVGLAL